MMVFDLTCLATRNANLRSRSSASVGARLVTVFSVMSSTTALSRLCTRRPPAPVFAVRPDARGSGRLPARRSRKFLRFAMIAMASSVASGAMITSVRISVVTRGGLGCADHRGQDSGDDAAGFGVERPIDGDDAAIGRLRIAGERLAIGADQIGAVGHAHGLGRLDTEARP